MLCCLGSPGSSPLPSLARFPFLLQGWVTRADGSTEHLTAASTRARALRAMQALALAGADVAGTLTACDAQPDELS